MVDEDIAAQRLKVVLPQFQPTGLDVYAVYPSRRNMRGRVRLFLDFLIVQFKSNASWQVSNQA
jgi:DNA-binding transcriptional LysR family regulator